jgi:hypothetical protein
MLSASSRRRRNRAPRGIGIDVALGGLPGGGRGALRDRRKTAIDAAAVDGVDLDADGMARIVGLRGCRRHAGQARSKQARGKQNRVPDMVRDRPPSFGRNQSTKLPWMASNCHAPGELPTKPAATRRTGAGQR